LGKGITNDSSEAEQLSGARRNMATAVEAKLLLGEALACEVVLPQGCTIYFGPGTTVYHAFGKLWDTVEKLLVDHRVRVATSNGWICDFLRTHGRWLAGRVELVGRVFVPEYASWVLLDGEPLPIDIDLAIVGLAGLDFSGKELEFRTCWQNQVSTVKLACMESKLRTIFIADEQKLTTSQGCTFVRASDFRTLSPDKRYDLLIAGRPSERTTLACDCLDRSAGSHTMIARDRVMRWSWGPMNGASNTGKAP
jgi:DeoR/GlpR family transcriptional regulator of sugar metabolism